MASTRSPSGSPSPNALLQEEIDYFSASHELLQQRKQFWLLLICARYQGITHPDLILGWAITQILFWREVEQKNIPAEYIRYPCFRSVLLDYYCAALQKTCTWVFARHENGRSNIFSFRESPPTLEQYQAQLEQSVEKVRPPSNSTRRNWNRA